MTIGDGAYKLLNSSSDELLADEKAAAVRETRPAKPTKVTLSDILVLCALLSSLASLALSLSVLRNPPTSPTPPATGKLRRPNAYIGLEKVKFPANATFPPIINYPLATFQIATHDKTRKMKEADRQFMTVEGVVNPEDHRVLISREESTVIQFRAMDWGMEDCVLHLSLPSKPNTPSNPDSDSQAPMQIDIWDLGADTELLPHITGDWPATAPGRTGGKPMATLRLGVGATLPFHCAQNSFPTFELACPPGEDRCSVDFWQDRERGVDSGIHIRQHWSRGTSEAN